MNKVKKQVMSAEEVKLFLELNNIEKQKAYSHDDYMYTSFTMLHHHKVKLDKLSKKYNMTRSAFFRLMLDNVKL